MCPGVVGVTELNPENATYTTSGFVPSTAMLLTNRLGSDRPVMSFQVAPPSGDVERCPKKEPTYRRLEDDGAMPMAVSVSAPLAVPTHVELPTVKSPLIALKLCGAAPCDDL